MSVEAIDVVTAAGELRARRRRRPTPTSSGRRAAPGPGFFGVVVALSPAPLPARRGYVANGVFLYPLDALEEVFRWAHEIGPRVAARRWS